MHVGVFADEVFFIVEGHLLFLLSDKDDPLLFCRGHKVLLELIDLLDELVSYFLTVVLDEKFWELFELLVEKVDDDVDNEVSLEIGFEHAPEILDE